MMSYVRSESVVSRVIAGETLIIPVRKNVGDLAAIYSLNSVGSLIWHLVAQPCSSDQILSAVENKFVFDNENVEHEVRGFLDEMCYLGLILSAPGAAQ